MNPASLAGHVLELLMLAERAGTPVDRVVSGFLRERSYLGSRDRRAISDVLFGVIRHRRHIETLLEEFLRQNPTYASIDAPARRFVSLLVVYSSIHQGLFREVPPPEGELLPVWSPYFPGLDPRPLMEWAAGAKDLGFLHEEPAVTLGVRHSFQDWMVDEWLARWPAGAEELLASLNRPGTVTLRVNTLKADTPACRERLAAEGIESDAMSWPDTALTMKKRFNQNASACFKDGWFEVQDAGSQVISLACAPAEGALVIDGCAGAGGKALHLAALMRNRGTIIAVDNDQGRLRELNLRARRGGVTIVSTAPAKSFPVTDYAGRADVVLVDAPCSGSGTIRRNPSLKWSISPVDVDRYAKRQLDLLGRYSQAVKPGGRLVYSTCSLFQAENEGVVEDFLSGDGAFSGIDACAGIPWEVERGPHGSVTLLPHRNPTDGFFIAVLERKK